MPRPGSAGLISDSWLAGERYGDGESCSAVFGVKDVAVVLREVTMGEQDVMGEQDAMGEGKSGSGLRLLVDEAGRLGVSGSRFCVVVYEDKVPKLDAISVPGGSVSI